jgi:hypothetical protein
MVQGVDPEFKPQYTKKKKKIQGNLDFWGGGAVLRAIYMLGRCSTT